MSYYVSLEDTKSAISLDIGSGSIKCGFSGDDAPLFDIQSIFGRQNSSSNQSYLTQAKPDAPDGRFFGEEALMQKSYLNLQHFMDNAMVTNWDALEFALHRIFYQKLKVEPECHPLVLNCMPLNPRSDKEKTTQVCFETFNTPGLYFTNPAQMALIASGRMHGISLMCGDGVSMAAPFFDDQEEFSVMSVSRMDFGGRDLSDYLLKLVMGNGKCSLTPMLGREVMREIKESGFCSCTPIPARNTVSNRKKYFTLPNGSMLTLEDELHECTEPLFNTNLVSSSLKFSGVHEMITQSIQKSPIECRRMLYSNILLVGGSTLFNGFKERLEKELSPMTTLPLTILTPKERKHTVWLGQSIYSSLESFQTKWLTKEEYDEAGPSITRRSCWLFK